MVNDMSAEQVYGNGSNSSIGTQFRTDYYEKKALVEAAKEQYFGQLADVKAMPKNMGKTIKQYHYMPILDDRNLNDQGIDANGVLAANVATDSGDPVAVVYIKAVAPAANGGMTYYFRGESGNATWATAAANALLEAKGNVNAFLYDQGFTVTQVSVSADYTALTAAATGWTFTEYAATVANNYGNLYGSSKDIGTITGKIPALGETGGRVNRVGMKRIDLTGTIAKFGLTNTALAA